MRFLNLNKLKVEKEYNYKEIDLELKLDDNCSIRSVKNAADVMFETLMPSAIETLYYVDINYNCDEELMEDSFLTFVNLILISFFDKFCLEDGRPRERRLDVPENIKQIVSSSYGLIKKAINRKTLADSFGLHIHWNAGSDLIYDYDLISQSYEPENQTIEKDFVHTVDELQREGELNE